MIKTCPRCDTKHSVLLITKWGPRCLYCARIERLPRHRKGE